jgi:hypothetical protein
MCDDTVFGEITSCSAISRLVDPAATSLATCERELALPPDERGRDCLALGVCRGLAEHAASPGSLVFSLRLDRSLDL